MQLCKTWISKKSHTLDVRKQPHLRKSMDKYPETVANYSAWDNVVFSCVLGVSAIIGLYHACTGGKQKSTAEFLLAGRTMSALPVALSVLASFFSASTLLGTPAEIYLQGIMYWISIFGAVLAPVMGAYVFGPFFHQLQLVSVFEVRTLVHLVLRW